MIRDSSPVPRSVSVIIVGAGFGGLCMAVALRKAGVGFLVLEKGHEVGGIWRDNTYPGSGCDVPSHLYSFSFQAYRSSTVRYPGQEQILDYLRAVADDHDLRPHLRTNTEVVSATYDEHSRKWTVATASGEEHVADVVVTAVGQLHRPKLPDIHGRESFAGRAFHTTGWPQDLDLTNLRVAVIGTGSSAAQLLPIVAGQARRVDVYQRTPNWVLPKPKAEFGSSLRWILRRLPFLHTVYRSLTYLASDLMLTPVIRHGWSSRPARWLARRHLRRQVADPALRAELTPDYPIGCKRIVIDNGFYPALARDNVELVTDGIERITADGIQTGSGIHRAADVLVYATGFRSTEFLVPMAVTGRDGRTLAEEWRDGAEAYLGMAVPGFPNFFLIHGPNTILGHNSNVFMIECQVRYIMNCLRMLPGAVEVRPEAMSRYQRRLDRMVTGTVWPMGCLSWYKTPTGRVTNPWPASTLRYRYLTSKDPGDAFSCDPGHLGADARHPRSVDQRLRLQRHAPGADRHDGRHRRVPVLLLRLRPGRRLR